MGKVMIITASQPIENQLLSMVSDLADSGLDIEMTVLPIDCGPNQLRDYVVNGRADVYIVGSSMPNTLSCYVAAHTRNPVIGIPISGDISDIDNEIFHIEGLPTGMPFCVSIVDDVLTTGKLAEKIIAEKAS